MFLECGKHIFNKFWREAITHLWSPAVHILVRGTAPEYSAGCGLAYFSIVKYVRYTVSD